MKRFIFILLIGFIAMSCSNTKKNDQANEALITSYVDAVQNLDYSIMESVLADDYLGVGPSINDSIDKKTAVAGWKYMTENLYERISYTKSQILPVTIPEGETKGEWVSNWAICNITYKNGGGEVSIMTNTVYLIENNKIAKSITFYNEADVLDQLGYVFINPNDF